MNNHHNSNNGFATGFIIGVVVGAVVVFLLATKKGKKLLKLFSEEGIEGVSELEELLAEEVVGEKEVPVKKRTQVVHETSKEEKEPIKPIPKLEPEPISSNIPPALGRIKIAPRRFFKGIPKRG